MNHKQPFLKYHKDLKQIKPDELMIGMKYIHIPDTLTPTEIKKLEFHIHTIRNKMKGESNESFEDHKRIYKRWAKEGVLYHPSKPSSKRSDSKNDGGLFNKK
jgi:hypothetical protein